MGNTCSHADLHIDFNDNINNSSYIDRTNTWKINVANCKCKTCGLESRAIKKTCIDHNISQNWRLITSNECTHDKISVTGYNYDTNNNTLTGRAICVVCTTSVPAVAEFTSRYEKNGNLELIVYDWSTDRSKYLHELKLSREKKRY
jgi:hypothetical protein